jgi:hypothetical protein
VALEFRIPPWWKKPLFTGTSELTARIGVLLLFFGCVSPTLPGQLETMIFHLQRHSLYSERALMSVKQQLWQESVEFFIVLAFEWHLSRHKI